MVTRMTKKRHIKQLSFESNGEMVAHNIIRKETLRFKDYSNRNKILYVIFYSESKRTRSQERKRVFECWLHDHQQDNTYLKPGESHV